jgi:hypothetical protein
MKDFEGFRKAYQASPIFGSKNFVKYDRSDDDGDDFDHACGRFAYFISLLSFTMILNTVVSLFGLGFILSLVGGVLFIHPVALWFRSKSIHLTKIRNTSSCSLCDNEDNEKATTLACEHIFHSKCLEKQNKKVCPTCELGYLKGFVSSGKDALSKGFPKFTKEFKPYLQFLLESSMCGLGGPIVYVIKCAHDSDFVVGRWKESKQQ